MQVAWCHEFVSYVASQASCHSLNNMQSQVGGMGYGGPQSYQPAAQPPPAYTAQMICPITKQPFHDPVIAADG